MRRLQIQEAADRSGDSLLNAGVRPRESRQEVAEHPQAPTLNCGLCFHSGGSLARAVVDVT
jgi:hypothetical protein